MWIFQGCIAPEIQHRYHKWPYSKGVAFGNKPKLWVSMLVFQGVASYIPIFILPIPPRILLQDNKHLGIRKHFFGFSSWRQPLWRPSIKQGTLYYQPKQCTKGNSLKITWINIHLYCLGSKKMREIPSTIHLQRDHPSIHPSIHRTSTSGSSELQLTEAVWQ